MEEAKSKNFLISPLLSTFDLCFTADPTGQQLSGDGSQVPVTVVGLDLDDSLRDVR